MTEFEYIEIHLLLAQSHGQATIFFVSIVFAYVVAAFVAGKKLAKVAAVSISVVYSILLIGPFSAIAGILDLGFINLSEYQIAFPEGKHLYAQGSLISAYFFAIGPLFLGWLGSLIYMHIYIRKDAIEHRSKDT